MRRTSCLSWVGYFWVGLIVLVGVGVGCASDDGGRRRDGGVGRARPEPERDGIRVMTQNLGYGGGAGLDVFTSAFSGMWKNVERSRPEERMAGIAEQIERHEPD